MVQTRRQIDWQYAVGGRGGDAGYGFLDIHGDKVGGVGNVEEKENSIRKKGRDGRKLRKLRKLKLLS